MLLAAPEIKFKNDEIRWLEVSSIDKKTELDDLKRFTLCRVSPFPSTRS